jgi:hypothetical protein
MREVLINHVSQNLVRPSRRTLIVPLEGVQFLSRAITMTERNIRENPSTQLC